MAGKPGQQAEPPIEHQPVLVDEVVRLLNPQQGDTILDGTVGLGGHALALLPLIGPVGRYIGLDRDAEMLAVARNRLSAFQTASLHQADYAEFPGVLKDAGVDQVDRMLLDLGVNSAQLDDPRRGFSLDRDGPLDMRFDQSQKRTAADLVNGLPENELADIFYHYGQETQSRKVARRICQVRHGARILTTRALAGAVESVLGGPIPGRTHPATRVFQALRIAVNSELDRLEKFLALVKTYLRPAGRLAVISFHSLEDAIVKKFVRNAAKAGDLIDLTRRPVIAGESERQANPRSRSAKLRAAERSQGAAL